MMSSGTAFETKRLVLRGAVVEDADDLFECFSDKEVMRYWSSLPHTSLNQTRTWVEKMVESPYNGMTDFLICLKANHDMIVEDRSRQTNSLKVIGKVGLWQDSEIGFLLNRQYWRRGFASEALAKLLDLIFVLEDSDVLVPDDDVPEDVTADVDPRNQASLGVLQRLGFQIYGTKARTFQVGDEWVDSVYLHLRREVWVTVRHEFVRHAD